MLPAWWATKDGDRDCLDLHTRHYSRYQYADGRQRVLLSGLGTNSSCAPNEVMQYSYGASSLMTASTSEQASDKKASTARSSETRASTYRHHSFAKRMQSLMQRGLIAGITPTSIAKRSPQATLDIAFSKPDGVDAGTPKAGCLYLSESSE